MYSTQQTSAVRGTTSINPNPARQRFHTPTVIVSNFCTPATNSLSSGMAGTTPTRVIRPTETKIIMNNRLTNTYSQVPTTSSMDNRMSNSSYGNSSYLPKVVVADNSGPDHDYNMPIYIPAASNLVVRPTTVLSAQHPARSSSLSYATSQRTCDVPETMKLPTLRGLPSVSRPIMSNEPELSGCARVRIFSSNHRDKFSMDYNDESRVPTDKRKREFAQVSRPIKPVNEFALLDSTKEIKSHGTICGFNDDESVVLRVDGDVKMIVDCDREMEAFAPPPKKNRPGRPRKYAEGTKPPRKDDDPDRKRRNRFKRRTQEEYQQVLDEINVKGLDIEDIGFLRTMFGRYQLDTTNDTDVPWGQRIPWMEMNLPPNPLMFPQPARLVNGKPEPYYVDEELKDVVPNVSGCARSEPYSSYLLRSSAVADNDSGFDETEIKSEDSKTGRKRTKTESKSDENLLSKMVQYPNSIKLKVIKSTSATAQQKYGVFAMETVEPNKVIVEFTGQVIRLDVAYTREERYWEMGIQPNMFKIDDGYVIDASREGSAARFIKHSCKPNCKAITKTVNGLQRLFVYSTTYIDKNEEIFIDYNLAGKRPRVECRCGARYCQGRL